MSDDFKMDFAYCVKAHVNLFGFMNSHLMDLLDEYNLMNDKCITEECRYLIAQDILYSIHSFTTVDLKNWWEEFDQIQEHQDMIAKIKKNLQLSS